MEKITIRAYAIRHKLSVFDVVKMTKSGQIPTEKAIEGGKDVVYILMNEDVENQSAKTAAPQENKEPYGLRKENALLKKEIEKLKLEISILKNKVQ